MIEVTTAACPPACLRTCLPAGDLTPEVFDDSCRFRDPTNDVVGLSRYVKVRACSGAAVAGLLWQSCCGGLTVCLWC
jgi:hypothetical protein